MCRHFYRRSDAGWLVGGVGFTGSDVDLSGHDLRDRGPLLLHKERNQLLFGGDVALDAVHRPIEEAGYGGLFGDRRSGYPDRLDCATGQSEARHPVCEDVKLTRDHRTLQSAKQITGIGGSEIWAKYCEMIADDNSPVGFLNQSGNTDVVPGLGVLVISTSPDRKPNRSISPAAAVACMNGSSDAAWRRIKAMRLCAESKGRASGCGTAR